MNRLLLFFLLVSGFANAQDVNIPDPIFKNRLINYPFHNIDTSGDGEIQVSEAQAYNLDLDLRSLGINDLTGIEAFTSLQTLMCDGNNLTSLNVSTLTGLDLLWCHNNNITSLDLTGCTNLISFTCTNNPITNINISGLAHLESIWCDNTNITSMDISALPTITSVVINNCSQLTSFRADNMINFAQLTIDNCPLLTELSIIGSNIDSAFSTMTNLPNLHTLDISGSNNITDLFMLFDSPNIESFDASNCASLQSCVIGTNTTNPTSFNITGSNQISYLVVAGFQFPSIDLSAFSNLFDLTIGGNALLTSIDLSANMNLGMVQMQSNNLNSVILPDTPSISLVDLSGNHLQSVDLSAYPNLDYVYLGNNPLQTINLKNGKIEQIIDLTNVTTLQHICADETQIVDVQTIAGPSVEVNSYCSFIPGGDYNTVAGTVRFDNDNNGCNAADTIIPHFLRVDITDGNLNGSDFVDANGHYSFYTGTGNFDVTPQLENPAYFNFTPATGNANFTALDNSVETIDFCMTANGTHPDLEAVLVARPPRPGFTNRYNIAYRNKGNAVLSGAITAAFDDARMDFVSAIPTVDTQSAGMIAWNFTNLQPFEKRIIEFTVDVNSSVDTPPVNDGDSFSFTASGDVTNEETPMDNTFTLRQIAVNSYDPNDKTCLEGENVTADNIGKYLHYNINFENIGSAEAINVVVKDTVNTAMFDISTLQVIHASHAVRAQVRGNVVEFIFENINLPSAIADPIGGHGNVLFKIKTLPTLQVGDVVTNTANIYFDYNHPIQTNEARTTFATLKRQEFITDSSILVFPNPAKQFISISAKNNIKSIAVFDVQGRILQTITADKNTKTIDVSDKTQGIYFFKITTADGIKVEKIIKQ